jgi:hypothetical protein
MLIWTLFFYLVCETRAQICPHLSVLSCIRRVIINVTNYGYYFNKYRMEDDVYAPILNDR